MYQARFFWSQAAELLFDNSHLVGVVLKHDEVSYFGDVSVFYKGEGFVGEVE